MSQPSRSKLGAAVTLYDDLNKAHQLLTLNVHFDGWFLPWHRYFVHAHEQLLRRVCGYRGAHPWWDETREAGHYSTGAVFNAASFGGNGTISGMPGTPEGQRCISDGPFKDYRYAVGPGMNDTEIPRCITRHLNDTFSMGAQQSEVDKCYAMTNYDTASTCLWGRPHVAGHRATGGEGLNIFSSPGDPTFYIHHAFIDRLWWNWQQRDLPKRLNELSGYTTFIEPITGWVNATMDDEMSVFGVHPNATIRQMMDVRGWPSCAEYVEPPAE
ncbi:hypothetical protein EDC01DRAFT_657047 [Geopyxis carbonaria]|nr:hypothetical protein EDC01DRAFT_657047 [Geopyxis carbonaria]